MWHSATQVDRYSVATTETVMGRLASATSTFSEDLSDYDSRVSVQLPVPCDGLSGAYRSSRSVIRRCANGPSNN